MNDYAMHAAALADLQDRFEGDCPVITFNDTDWPIIPGSTIRRKDLAAGGFQLNADFHFEALISTFAILTDPPADAKAVKEALLQTQIGYLGDEYKPIAVHILPGGLQLMVECNSLVEHS